MIFVFGFLSIGCLFGKLNPFIVSAERSVQIASIPQTDELKMNYDYCVCSIEISHHQFTCNRATTNPTIPNKIALLSRNSNNLVLQPFTMTLVSLRSHMELGVGNSLQHSLGKVEFWKTGRQSSGPVIPQHLNYTRHGNG